MVHALHHNLPPASTPTGCTAGGGLWGDYFHQEAPIAQRKTVPGYQVRELDEAESVALRNTICEDLCSGRSVTCYYHGNSIPLQARDICSLISGYIKGRWKNKS